MYRIFAVSASQPAVELAELCCQLCATALAAALATALAAALAASCAEACAAACAAAVSAILATALHWIFGSCCGLHQDVPLHRDLRPSLAKIFETERVRLNFAVRSHQSFFSCKIFRTCVPSN